MRRPAVLTFISSKRRRATRRAIFPSTSSHTLSVRSADPDTTVPFDRTATQLTCARRGVDERSTRCVDWTPAPRCVRVPGQRPEALTARHVPHLEREVARPGHDAAVRQGGDAPDLRPSRRRRAIDALCRLDAGAALRACARAASPRSGSAIGQPWAALWRRCAHKWHRLLRRGV